MLSCLQTLVQSCLFRHSHQDSHLLSQKSSEKVGGGQSMEGVEAAKQDRQSKEWQQGASLLLYYSWKGDYLIIQMSLFR